MFLDVFDRPIKVGDEVVVHCKVQKLIAPDSLELMPVRLLSLASGEIVSFIIPAQQIEKVAPYAVAPIGVDYD